MSSLQSSECVDSFSEVETEARMVYRRRKGLLGIPWFGGHTK